MEIKEVAEWLYKANNEIDSADYCKNSGKYSQNENIFYHYTQAVEKYIKGFLVYNDIEFSLNHNLNRLNELCIGKIINLRIMLVIVLLCLKL